jgi:hypothetical protein
MSSEQSSGDVRLRNLRPFPQGRSGNPSGRNVKRDHMLAGERTKLESHHGRALTRPEELLVYELVSVLLTRPRDTTEATKRATSVAKLVERLYSGLLATTKPAPKAGPDSLKNYARDKYSVPA